MNEKVQEIMKFAIENNHNPMDLVTAADNLIKDELYKRVEENGGCIEFADGEQPCMVCDSLDFICDVRISRVYIEDGGLKCYGTIIETDWEDNFDIDDFRPANAYNILCELQ